MMKYLDKFFFEGVAKTSVWLVGSKAKSPPIEGLFLKMFE